MHNYERDEQGHVLEQVQLKSRNKNLTNLIWQKPTSCQIQFHHFVFNSIQGPHKVNHLFLVTHPLKIDQATRLFKPGAPDFLKLLLSAKLVCTDMCVCPPGYEKLFTQNTSLVAVEEEQGNAVFAVCFAVKAL